MQARQCRTCIFRYSVHNRMGITFDERQSSAGCLRNGDFMNSIIGNKKARSAVEQTAEIIFTICAFFRRSCSHFHYSLYVFKRYSRPYKGGTYRDPVQHSMGSQPLQIPVTAFYTSF